METLKKPRRRPRRNLEGDLEVDLDADLERDPNPTNIVVYTWRQVT